MPTECYFCGAKDTESTKHASANDGMGGTQYCCQTCGSYFLLPIHVDDENRTTKTSMQGMLSEAQKDISDPNKQIVYVSAVSADVKDIQQCKGCGRHHIFI